MLSEDCGSFDSYCRNADRRSSVRACGSPLGRPRMEIRRTLVTHAVVGVAAVLLFAATAARAASPCEILRGTWAGSGNVQFEGARSERLRCNAYYTNSGGGDVLGLAIRCASASNRIEIRGRLNYHNGNVSGTWEERTFNASGTATGRASDSRVSL